MHLSFHFSLFDKSVISFIKLNDYQKWELQNSSKYESFNARAGHYNGRHFFGHESPTARAVQTLRRFGTSSSFDWKKMYVSFGFGVLCGGRQKAFFEFLANLSGPGRQLNESWLQIFLGSKLNPATFEPLIGFLAYLEAKIMAQKTMWQI